MNTMERIETELLLKEQRVFYWELFGVVPTIKELNYFVDIWGVRI